VCLSAVQSCEAASGCLPGPSAVCCPSGPRSLAGQTGAGLVMKGSRQHWNAALFVFRFLSWYQDYSLENLQKTSTASAAGLLLLTQLPVIPLADLGGAAAPAACSICLCNHSTSMPELQPHLVKVPCSILVQRDSSYSPGFPAVHPLVAAFGAMRCAPNVAAGTCVAWRPEPWSALLRPPAHRTLRASLAF